MVGGGAGAAAGARSRCPHAATVPRSPRAANAPAQNLIFFVPTPKPYKAVIPRPTDMADREFTFTAGIGRQL
jgi:hypothetical protein